MFVCACVCETQRAKAQGDSTSIPDFSAQQRSEPWGSKGLCAASEFQSRLSYVVKSGVVLAKLQVCNSCLRNDCRVGPRSVGLVRLGTVSRQSQVGLAEAFCSAPGIPAAQPKLTQLAASSGCGYHLLRSI